MELPQIVSREEWQQAHEALLAKEKQATRERDALAAERRRQPMMEFVTDYEFEGPDGVVTLRRPLRGPPAADPLPLLVPAGRDPCGGCSMFTDQVSELAHLNARDVTFAIVSTAPQDADRRAQGADGLGRCPGTRWSARSSRRRWGRASTSRCNVFLRDGDRVFLTYETTGRGVEALGSVWTFLDLTPLGRQEEWEDTPPGRPQTPPYQWWRLHDSYA